MNRRERRQHVPANVRALAAAKRCPDCLSTVDPIQMRPGLWIVEVRHDQTCPTLANLRARGLAP
ncbi:hypothetical protein [Mycolicibacterium elephantis]|uniref:hypothetical protein n=1 Tax=Mycolicibacterium elephantis TaxID=81858 RepID=UPI000FE1B7B0|nr:hypothetical protein [Mycolicibacterium elephantis]MCV7222960.1 hypothetical protein [Mycolicibacterium elephantis]